MRIARAVCVYNLDDESRDALESVAWLRDQASVGVQPNHDTSPTAYRLAPSRTAGRL